MNAVITLRDSEKKRPRDDCDDEQKETKAMRTSGDEDDVILM
jgi:hypothetical protein